MSIERHCALQVFKFEHFHALIHDFITAQTAFCHCTVSIYHCTFCASLHVKKCPDTMDASLSVRHDHFKPVDSVHLIT